MQIVRRGAIAQSARIRSAGRRAIAKAAFPCRRPPDDAERSWSSKSESRPPIGCAVLSAARSFPKNRRRAARTAPRESASPDKPAAHAQPAKRQANQLQVRECVAWDYKLAHRCAAGILLAACTCAAIVGRRPAVATAVPAPDNTNTGGRTCIVHYRRGKSKALPIATFCSHPASSIMTDSLADEPARPRGDAAPPTAHRPWQFSIRQLMLAAGLLATACGSAAAFFRNDPPGWAGAAGVVGAFALLSAAIGALAGKAAKCSLVGALVGLVALTGQLAPFVFLLYAAIIFVVWSAVRRKREIDPAREIARRQNWIYRTAAGWVVACCVAWLPMMFFTPPGSGCRPMLQLPLTVFVLPVVTFTLLWRAIDQFEQTRPRVWLGTKAVIMALLPLAAFALSQWIILCVLKITYEP